MQPKTLLVGAVIFAGVASWLLVAKSRHPDPPPAKQAAHKPAAQPVRASPTEATATPATELVRTPVPIFPDIAWGADEAEIVATLGLQLHKEPKRQQFAGMYVDHSIPEVQVAGVPMEAFFQMDDSTGRLTQVLLRKQVNAPRRGTYEADFEKLVTFYTAKLGAPEIGNTGPPDGTNRRDRRWVDASSSVVLGLSQTVYSDHVGELLTVRYFPAGTR